MVRPEKFSFEVDRDERGEFVRASFEIRSKQQADRIIEIVGGLKDLISPQVVIHALACEHYVETEETPVVRPALKLVAN